MGRPRTLALGAWLAARGALSAVGLVITGLAALAAVAVAFALHASGGRGAAQLPLVAARGIAWSGGVMLAFGASLKALARDREEGVLALARARGASVATYLRGRVAGLTSVLAAAVGGATVVAAMAATAAAGSYGHAAAAVRASVAALAYALAFAATMGPVAMAALGARSRAGGYLTLLAVLVVPEALSHWTGQLLPAGWHELTSIPAALEGIQDGVLAPGIAGAHLARAVIGLAAVVAVSLVVAGARVAGPDREAAP